MREGARALKRDRARRGMKIRGGNKGARRLYLLRGYNSNPN